VIALRAIELDARIRAGASKNSASMTTSMLTGEVRRFYAEYRRFGGGHIPRRNGTVHPLCARQLSVRICSALNRRFADWGEVFPNAACVVSLVDRLMHRAEGVRIEGDSYRQKEAEERAMQRAAARTAAARTKGAATRKSSA
jgi:hypothetical protein